MRTLAEILDEVRVIYPEAEELSDKEIIHALTGRAPHIVEKVHHRVGWEIAD